MAKKVDDEEKEIDDIDKVVRDKNKATLNQKAPKVQIGLVGTDTLKRLGVESEKVIDRIYLQIIEKLNDNEEIRKFTVLADYNEVKNIMSMEVLNELFLKKYCDIGTEEGKRSADTFDNLLLHYQQYLISNNDGRGRRDHVQLFTGSAGDSTPSFNIRKMLIDKLHAKKGLGGDTI